MYFCIITDHQDTQ